MTRTSSRIVAPLVVAFIYVAVIFAEPLASPTWGFFLDLPEGFQLTGGDHKNRFSFQDSTSGAHLDLVAYPAGRYPSAEALIEDAKKRLLAEGDTSGFDYRGRRAALMRMEFTAPFGPASGWALAAELNAAPGQEKRPLLLFLAYGEAGAAGNENRYLSALDSLAPSVADRFAPGPISVFSYPSEGKKTVELRIGDTRTSAVLDASDAEAAKATVEREFALLTTYAASPLWKEAWIRFYRAVWRDSYERLAGVSFAVERALAADADTPDPRRLAEGVLGWVQGFNYERDLLGTDFVDLVSAATEGRGDCDSRSLLMAIILQRANMDALLMVSREYSHAMAAVKTEGKGARFPYAGTDWIVAETTAKVALGMIGQNVADPKKWIGIDFPSLPPAGSVKK